MCGIIGIVSAPKETLIPDLVAGLCDLEYRGYDSSGIAILREGELLVHKAVGAPSDTLTTESLKERFGENPVSHIGIGHNRWATHGKPSEQNAHPHTDCTGSIALVHNGTILNYDALKQELVAHGHTFTSETDTETIAHLIEEEVARGNTLETAFLKTLKRIEGSFGIAVMSVHEPGVLYVARNGSPLYLGITPTRVVLASSTNALLRHTATVLQLGDREWAHIAVNEGVVTYQIKHIDSGDEAPQREPLALSGLSLHDLSRGEFDTFMLKEIYEQPAAFRTTILGRYDKDQGNAVLGGLIDHEEFLRSAKTILTVACGTAHHAALIGKELIERMTPILVRNEIASEWRYKTCHADPKTTALFAVSQSGETADTLESVKEAKRKGYATFGIVNVVGSSIAEETAAGVFTRAGAEIGVASTKAFTAQASIFYLLALALGRFRGVSPHEGRAFLDALELIPEQMQETLRMCTDAAKEVARAAATMRTVSFLGRGVHLPIAHEAALKFKELTYVEAGSYPLGELKHGPIAIMDETALSVVIMPRDDMFELSKNSIEQIRSKGGKVAIITDEGSANDPLVQRAEYRIIIPTLSDPRFYPLLEILPLQLLAYHAATFQGKNVDKPRNLAKSVTVE